MERKGCRCAVIGSGFAFADWVIVLEVSVVPPRQMGFRPCAKGIRFVNFGLGTVFKTLI
jgi:hypothetical protein